MKFGVQFMYGEERGSGAGASNLGDAGDRGTYFLHGAPPQNVYQSMLGVVFDHVLNPSTFYNVRLSRVASKTRVTGPRIIRDPSVIKTFGNVEMDERPWGYETKPGYQYALVDQMVLGGVGGGHRDLSEVVTYNVKLDFTTQINKYNQIQAGIDMTKDDYDVFIGELEVSDVTGNHIIDWEESPIRAGAYIQDKLEWEGMIANIGLRIDYNDPNTEWYTADRYSSYFTRVALGSDILTRKAVFTELAPTEPTDSEFRIAPRLGISHPITDVSKLYFNYGHFYSMPTTEDMYQINYGYGSSGIENLGNPNLKMPRTIAYELGYDHEIADMFLIKVAGYYKDVTNQVGYTTYLNYDESVSYSIAENHHYADQRGLEVEIRKTWGQWITGWLNYNYQVTTEGMIGRETQYQDPRKQASLGLRDPFQEKPLPQPFARGQVQIRTPYEWGPKFGQIHPFDQLSFSILGRYKAGDYLTWEPLPGPGGVYTEDNNLQWKDQWMFDARFLKNLNINKYEFTFFLDIQNIFDLQFLTGGGFTDDVPDWRDYLNSLHLPMYKESRYQGDPTYTSGNDEIGDVWSEDKPYINMPNLDFLAWSIPRRITIGLQFSF